ncbi:hypothetical protein F4861DRAFT_112514 [Xylaria intraflava]|nr:hypothetical protein F4861DRAFT_112514 [Xylaria intraflava]
MPMSNKASCATNQATASSCIAMHCMRAYERHLLAYQIYSTICLGVLAAHQAGRHDSARTKWASDRTSLTWKTIWEPRKRPHFCTSAKARQSSGIPAENAMAIGQKAQHGDKFTLHLDWLFEQRWERLEIVGAIDLFLRSTDAYIRLPIPI